MGQSTFCSACRVRLKATGAMWGQVQHHLMPGTVRMPARPLPQDSLILESSPVSLIWEPGSVSNVYLMRKKPVKWGKPPPMKTHRMWYLCIYKGNTNSPSYM